MNNIKNFFAELSFNILGIFIMLVIIWAAWLVFVVPFLPSTLTRNQCRVIFDLPKSEINEMQQEYYNKNCK
jgi:hypothetical protein